MYLFSFTGKKIAHRALPPSARLNASISHRVAHTPVREWCGLTTQCHGDSLLLVNINQGVAQGDAFKSRHDGQQPGFEPCPAKARVWENPISKFRNTWTSSLGREKCRYYFKIVVVESPAKSRPGRLASRLEAMCATARLALLLWLCVAAVESKVTPVSPRTMIVSKREERLSV